MPEAGLAKSALFLYKKEQVPEYRWNEWNVEHIARHGVRPDEAGEVIDGARSPYPMERTDEKWLVWGRTHGGRIVQVVFLLDPDDVVYVIHARDLTPREKRQLRRRSR